MVISLEFDPELVVENSQVSVPAAHDRIWRNCLHLLRYDADIDLFTAVVAKAIKAETIVEPTDKADVVLGVQI